MRSLHVSLGHNSSACLAVDGVVTRGYEQERIDRRKSSSAYPSSAIALAIYDGDHRQWPVDVAYVSHWFDQFDLPNLNCKYLDFGHLAERVGKVQGLSEEFTHHDAHAHSAVSFARGRGIAGPAMVVVADGFGNLQECFSAYRLENGRLERLHRTHGYGQSLGLMYQYATESLGLAPNRDEYKLLGYEAHILEYLPKDLAERVRGDVSDAGRRFAMGMLERTKVPQLRSDELIDRQALLMAKEEWFEQVALWHSMMPVDRLPASVRPFIAFCAQSFLESAMVTLVRHLLPSGCRQLILTGGCFYNVKLTRRIMVETNCRVFAHPLAGDQGAALGMGDAPALLSLCVGDRNIRWKTVVGSKVNEVLFAEEDRWADYVAVLLSQDKIVNLVRGNMEYGPRALCNTSTLALPTLDNVMRINRLNERDEAMPMAPVLTERAARDMFRFDELALMKGSEGHMICTVAWDSPPPEYLAGVAHRDPLEPSLFTSRPQVITQSSDPGMFDILSTTPYETLINTSFNYHGEPIVMTMDDALRTHDMQSFRARTLGLDPPTTVLVLS